MYFYTAYGLHIGSEIAFPELTPLALAGVPDVLIRFGQITHLPAEIKADHQYIAATGQEITLVWDDIGAFQVRGGREIVADPRPGLPESVLRLFILGTTWAMLLHQRGETAVLHASVVSVGGRAVVFVGDKGAGKSTTATTFHARGHPLLADDIVAVDLRGREPQVWPGFPFVRLWPDSVMSLGQEPDDLPRLRPELDKRGLRLAAVTMAPVPLQGIFVLGYGPFSVTRLSGREALWAVMPHWYGARFGEGVVQALGLSNYFQQCAALVKQVSVWRWERPSDLSTIHEVAARLESYII